MFGGGSNGTRDADHDEEPVQVSVTNHTECKIGANRFYNDTLLPPSGDWYDDI